MSTTDITSTNYDNHNVFAKILRGELPAHKVYEDDNTLAFMDVMPQVDGHTLVIHKYPAATLMDLPTEQAQQLMATLQKVAAAVKKSMNSEGVVIMQLNGKAAGQTVPHLHFHVIPGSIADLRKPHAHTMADGAVLAEYAQRIKAAF